MNQHALPARILIFFLISLLVGSPNPGTAEPGKLPQDILFYEIDYAQSPVQYRLSWLSAANREITTFYHDPEFAYWPVAWSPTGRYLAAIRIIDSMSGQLCLFTREGELRQCVKKLIESDSYSGKGNRMAFHVRWSDDETKITYIAVDDQTLEGYMFYEASTETCEITRLLYKGITSNRYGEFTWTPQHDVIIENVRNINLGKTQEVTNFVQINAADPAKSVKVPFKYLIPDVATATTEPNAVLDGETRHLLDPCPFSPKGTYVAAFDIGENSLMFALLDKHANIVQMISKSALIPLPVNCPAWASDESSFYYWKLDGRIYKYFVAEKKYETFYDGEAKPLFWADFGVSDDQNYLLNIAQEYVALSTPVPKNAQSYVYRLVVIGPHNNVEFLGNKYSDSVLPLWVPPLKH